MAMSEGPRNEESGIAAQCFPLHTEGPCEVLRLTSDGTQLVSAGGDGKLLAATVEQAPTRTWTHRIAERGTLTAAAISAADGRLPVWLAIGVEQDHDCGVWVCQLDDKTGRPREIPRLVARATLLVRHLAWHGTFLGIATDDGKLSVWDREGDSAEGTKQPRRRDFPTGSSGGSVRCLAFDPRGEFLAAAFTCGALAVFGLRDASERYRAAAFPKVAVGSERILISWSPDGKILAIPGESSVRLVARGDYDLIMGRLENGHKHPTTAVAWSTNGCFLASASCEAVSVWQPPLLRFVCHLHSQPYSMVWGGAFLAIGTAIGSWARLTVDPEATEPVTWNALSTDTEAQHGRNESVGTTADVSCVETDVAEQPQPPDVTLASVTQMSPAVLVGEAVLNLAPQVTFQPGATTHDRRQCFLAWNEHGTMKFLAASNTTSNVRSSESRRSRKVSNAGMVDVGRLDAGRVQIEYSRGCGRSAVREFRAPMGLALGALGPGICALGARAVGQCLAKIIVHLASPWDCPYYEHELPAGESMEALAVGRHFVATFTTPKRFLRVNTLAGLPIAVLTLGGDIVCLAACEDLLLCVTQEACPPSGEPVLEYALYGVSAKERLAAGRLPLSPSSTLRWLGFSAEALPLALDNAGALRALALSGSIPLLAPAAGEWLTVAELEDRGLRLWPVRAEGSTLHCAVVSKDSEEPRTGIVHKLRGVRFSLPLGGETAGLENMLRQNLLAGHVEFTTDVGIIPTPTRNVHGTVGGLHMARGGGRRSMKLFESLVKSGEVERALDVASHYFNAHIGGGNNSSQQQVDLLEEARVFLSGLEQEPLSQRVTGLLKRARERRERPTSQEKEDDHNSDDSKGVEESSGEG